MQRQWRHDPVELTVTHYHTLRLPKPRVWLAEACNVNSLNHVVAYNRSLITKKGSHNTDNNLNMECVVLEGLPAGAICR